MGEIIGKRKFVGYSLEDNFPTHPPPLLHQEAANVAQPH